MVVNGPKTNPTIWSHWREPRSSSYGRNIDVRHLHCPYFIQCQFSPSNIYLFWREPRSSGYVRGLIIKRIWVQIPAPYTSWTNCNVCLKKTEKIKKRPGEGPFLLNKHLHTFDKESFLNVVHLKA